MRKHKLSRTPYFDISLISTMTLDEILSSPNVSLDATHLHDCPFWRMGKKHGECWCGAVAMQQRLDQIVKDAKLRVEVTRIL